MALPEPLALVPVAEVADQLRIDTDAENAWLQAAVWAVSRVVLHWCGGDLATIAELDEDGAIVRVYPDVVHAVKIEIAYQSTNREGPAFNYQQDWAARGYPLSAGAVALLQRYHAPVTA